MVKPLENRKIDTVVFDIGNVLVDFDPRYMYRKVFADEAEMERFIETVTTPAWHLEQDRGRTMAVATRLLVSEHPERRDQIEAYYKRWDEMFNGPIPGSVDILHELEGRGYTLYALTNWSAELFGRARETFPFLGVFREIVVSGELGLIKPDLEIYGVLVDRTGLDPGTSAFIDDSPANVETANRLGFTGIAFTDPPALRDDLAELGLLDRTGAAG
ncbi:HAD family hydrolase [Rubrobacter indicoceani]|uniref:HAD family hydrolase n=1 Tax=Rubrobacter indicoceani TaxID=2051957 RepID=UPI001969209B|nr:HAD family phosphatase [Rubrobacter indicoceani]